MVASAGAADFPAVVSEEAGEAAGKSYMNRERFPRWLAMGSLQSAAFHAQLFIFNLYFNKR